jgi:hypothetical protein
VEVLVVVGLLIRSLVADPEAVCNLEKVAFVAAGKVLLQNGLSEWL